MGPSPTRGKRVLISLGPWVPYTPAAHLSHPLFSWPPALRDVLGGAGKPDQRLPAPPFPQSGQVPTCAPSGQTRWQRPRLRGAAGRTRRTARGFRGAASPISTHPPLSATAPTPALALVTMTGGEGDAKCSPDPSVTFRVQGVAGAPLNGGVGVRDTGSTVRPEPAPSARHPAAAAGLSPGRRRQARAEIGSCTWVFRAGCSGTSFPSHSLVGAPGLGPRSLPLSLRPPGVRLRHCSLDGGGRRKLV